LARLAVAMAVLLPAATWGGPIYGTIVGGPNPKRIDVGCPDFEAQSYRIAGQTDNSGSFRMNVAWQGRCLLRVNNSAPVTVFSSNNPIRYDFELAGQRLRRR
jgi:hypothetical protein